MADTHNEAEVKTAHPEVEGTVADTAGTKKLTGDKYLVTSADESYVRQKERTGFN